MAHKTFISYKYSEAQELRDKIIKALGDDASYYQGETSDSPDLTDTSTENIKKNLKDMMYGTSVTIIIISPHIKESKWIDWEIEYCLKTITRNNRTSHTSGLVGVIMKVNGGYDWFKFTSTKPDGCSVTNYYDSKVYDIINNNRYNQHPKVYSCNQCKCVNAFIIGKTNRDEIQNQMRLKFARKLQKRNVTENSHTSYSQKWLSNVN